MAHQIIGNCVKDQRLKSTLTQAELAEQVGIARISITSIETGRHIPTIDTALRLSRILKVPVDDLFWIKDVKK